MKITIKLIKVLIDRFNTHFEKQIAGRGHQKVKIFGDLLVSYAINGSTLTEYFEYEFYKKSSYEKKYFVTYRKARKLFKVFNDCKHIDKLNDKALTNTYFESYLGRDWLNVSKCTLEEFKVFCTEHSNFIVKPTKSSLGKGVRKVNFNESIDINLLYKELVTRKFIVEEYIQQIDSMREFHESSVNTIRVTTVRTNNDVKVMSAALRLGNNGLEIDNHASGGIIASIDVEDGIVITQGIDKFGKRYIKHPMSQKIIVGYKVPYCLDSRPLITRHWN